MIDLEIDFESRKQLEQVVIEVLGEFSKFPKMRSMMIGLKRNFTVWPRTGDEPPIWSYALYKTSLPTPMWTVTRLKRTKTIRVTYMSYFASNCVEVKDFIDRVIDDNSHIAFTKVK